MDYFWNFPVVDTAGLPVIKKRHTVGNRQGSKSYEFRINLVQASAVSWAWIFEFVLSPSPGMMYSDSSIPAFFTLRPSLIWSFFGYPFFRHLGDVVGTGFKADVGAKIEKRGDEPFYVEAAIDRTAHRLMEGYVLVPEKYFQAN